MKEVRRPSLPPLCVLVAAPPLSLSAPSSAADGTRGRSSPTQLHLSLDEQVAREATTASGGAAQERTLQVSILSHDPFPFQCCSFFSWCALSCISRGREWW
ncbi:hypothetical protein VPH35_029204 [Triticum aestivum]